MVVFYAIVLLFIAAIVFVSLQQKSIDVFGLTLAAGLAAALIFLFLLRRKSTRESSDPTGSHRLTASRDQARNVAFFVGGLGIVLGMFEAAALLQPVTNRQPASLTSTITALTGPYGPPVIYVALGVYLIWRARKV